jgi:CRP/FNR family transcriptional regulator, anaerobic regulatory protein
MEFVEEFSYLFEKELIEDINKSKSIKTYQENEIILEMGETISSIPFIVEGAVKVIREDQNGDELLLYYLESGDTCTMTLSCCLGKKKSKIKAVAEEKTTLMFIPMEKSSEWLGKYESWRNFIFSSYEAKFTEMLDAIDALAFFNMEDRVMKYLTDKAKVLGNLELSNTHQEIAEDLHSSRVVISRILKKLELEGKLKITRNKIQIFEI